jgi:hypothetical protein
VVAFQETTGSDALDAPTLGEPEDQPLLAPVMPLMSWASVHSMSQSRLRDPRDPTEARSIAVIRRTATIRRGTRMLKLLSSRQLSGYLHGRLPGGFCYRAVDVAHLRAPDELAMLTGDAIQLDRSGKQFVFGLRWRATDPLDYAIPFSVSVGGLPSYQGLTAIPPHDRLGPPVLGTGFAPSQHHLVPEFVTTDLADIPLPAGSTLVAFAPDGIEVGLYLYLPEQRAWTRMFGPQWRHLVATVPEVPPDQEYVPFVTDHSGGTTLIGSYQGTMYEALADPPHEYRVLARARAARYPVETLIRRTRHATWRGVACTVVRADRDWLRLRVCRPDADNTAILGAQCVERGVYEVWCGSSEVTIHDTDVVYPL